MSCQDADQLPYTRCLHGKRPCHQQDVNRRCIPSVTAAMTDDSKERFLNSILEPKIILLPSTNGTLHKPSTHSVFVSNYQTMKSYYLQTPSTPLKMRILEQQAQTTSKESYYFILKQIYSESLIEFTPSTINLLFGYTTAHETVYLRRT